MRRHDTDLDGVYDKTYYHLTDDQFSTIALIGASGSLIERISYDPFGRARHHRRADLDGDGTTGVADQLILQGNWGDYGVGDLDRDGTVGNSDLLILLGNWGGALPAGQLSTPGIDNHFGYAGYVFNTESQLYVVRFRWYVWHHHQDGTTMQLIPENIHGATGHTGGAAVQRAKPCDIPQI